MRFLTHFCLIYFHLQEWSDLPAPYKYYGVKVNPEHVEKPGFVWKLFSDWKIAVPTTFLFSLPLWMFNFLPPFDERMELYLILFGAGWVAVKQAGPLFTEYKLARVGAKVKAILGLEAELNQEIASAIDTYKAAADIPKFIASVNAGERALKSLEADAATKRVPHLLRDSVVAQLDYLVSIAGSGAQADEANALKLARASVESTLEKDSAVQLKSIEAAVKALSTGTASDDVISPLFSKALEQARKELASKPASNPLKNAAQIELFRKRFNLVEDAVSESTISKADSDASKALLVGRIGGGAPTVGAKYVMKPAILYAN
jgi:hypothetical protein